MKKHFAKHLIFFSGLILLIVLLLYWQNPQTEAEEIPLRNHELALAINECENITEKSAAHLTAIVEFQKLEIAGRKARVFRMCMQDHGYKKSAEWDQYIMPSAKKLSKENKISIDEAYESLSRQEMKLSETEQDHPFYWVAK